MNGCKVCRKWPPFSALLQGRDTCSIISKLLDGVKNVPNLQADAIGGMQDFTETYGCAAFEQSDETMLRLWRTEIDHKLKNIEGDTPAYYTRNNIIAIIEDIQSDLHLMANCVREEGDFSSYEAVTTSDVDMVIHEKIEELKRGGCNE